MDWPVKVCHRARAEEARTKLLPAWPAAGCETETAAPKQNAMYASYSVLLLFDILRCIVTASVELRLAHCAIPGEQLRVAMSRASIVLAVVHGRMAHGF